MLFDVLNGNMSGTMLDKYLDAPFQGRENSSYLPRAQEGDYLIPYRISCKSTTIELTKYLETSKDRMFNFIENHERRRKLHSVIY